MMTLSFRRPAALRAAALFLAFGLTACAGGSIQAAPAEEAKPTLTICTEPHWQDPQALPLFRAEHPEIDLKVEYLPELYDYDLLFNTTFDWETSTGEKSTAREAAINRIKNQLMAGEGPDVFWLWVAEICDPYVYRSANNFVFSDFSKMAASGAFLDLKPLLTEELLAQMSQPFQDWVARQEHVYYLPLGYELCGALMPEAVWQAHPELLEPETDFFAYFQNFADTCGEDSLKGFTGMLPCMALAKSSSTLSEVVARADLSDFLTLQTRIRKAQGYYPGTSNPEKTRDLWCDALSQGWAPFQGESCYDFYMLNTARVLSGMENETKFVPVPNDDGGVTAIVTAALVARSNTAHPELVQQMIESFLSEKSQRSGFPDYGSTFDNFPVRKGMLADMLSDTLSHNWVRSDTSDGDPQKDLSQATIQTFLDAEARITNYILPDASALEFYEACEGYTTGRQTLERTQYELDKAFVLYADE